MDPRTRVSVFEFPGGDKKHLATFLSDKWAGKENSECRGTKLTVLKYANKTSVVDVTGQTAHFVRISIGNKNNIMHPVACILDARAKPNIISKNVLPTNRMSKISREIQPSLTSAPEDQLKTKVNITLHIRFGNFLTSARITVAENLATEVLLDTTFTDEQTIAILPVVAKATVRESTPTAIVK